MRRSAQSRDVGYLLDELCTRFGYRNALRDIAQFEGIVQEGLDAFANAVVAAEGIDPRSSTAGDVRELVAKHFSLWAARDVA